MQNAFGQSTATDLLKKSKPVAKDPLTGRKIPNIKPYKPPILDQNRTGWGSTRQEPFGPVKDFMKAHDAYRKSTSPWIKDDGTIDYAQMPWDRVWSKAAWEFPGSAAQNIGEIWEMIKHPVQTAEVFDQLGKEALGAGYDKFNEALESATGLRSWPKSDTPLLNMVFDTYAQNYDLGNNQEALKRYISEEPASFLEDMGIIATIGLGGSAAAAKGTRVLSKLGKLTPQQKSQLKFTQYLETKAPKTTQAVQSGLTYLRQNIPRAIDYYGDKAWYIGTGMPGESYPPGHFAKMAHMMLNLTEVEEYPLMAAGVAWKSTEGLRQKFYNAAHFVRKHFGEESMRTDAEVQSVIERASKMWEEINLQDAEDFVAETMFGKEPAKTGIFSKNFGKTPQEIYERAMGRTFGVEIEFLVPYDIVVDRAQTINDIERIAQNYGVTIDDDASIRHDIDSNTGEFVEGVTFEAKTDVLQGEEGILELIGFAKELEAYGAKVNDSTGLHVHIGKDELTSEEYANLAMAWGKYEWAIDMMYKYWRRENRGYSDSVYTAGPRGFPAGASENQRHVAWEQWLQKKLNEVTERYGENASQMAMSEISRILPVRGKFNIWGTGGGDHTIEFRGAEGTVNWKDIERNVRFMLNFVERFRGESVFPWERGDRVQTLDDLMPGRAGQTWINIGDDDRGPMFTETEKDTIQQIDMVMKSNGLDWVMRAFNFNVNLTPIPSRTENMIRRWRNVFDSFEDFALKHQQLRSFNRMGVIVRNKRGDLNLIREWAETVKGGEFAEEAQDYFGTTDPDQLVALAEQWIKEENRKSLPDAKMVQQRIRTLRVNIENGDPVDLKGRNVSSAEELAVLGQFIRNPTIEKTWVVYIKEGQVHHHEVVTLNSPDETIAPHVNEINQRMQILEADSVAVIHNHPGGRAQYSAGDMWASVIMEQTFGDEFIGSVVIDSGTYAHMMRNADGTLGEMDEPVNELTLPADLVGWDTSAPYQRYQGQTDKARIRQGDPVYTGYRGGRKDAKRWEQGLEEERQRDPFEGDNSGFANFAGQLASNMRHLLSFGQYLKIGKNWVNVAYMSDTGRVNSIVEYQGLQNLTPEELKLFIKEESNKFGGQEIHIFIGEGDWYNTTEEAHAKFKGLEIDWDIDDDPFVQEGAGVVSISRSDTGEIMSYDEDAFKRDPYVTEELRTFDDDLPTLELHEDDFPPMDPRDGPEPDDDLPEGAFEDTTKWQNFRAIGTGKRRIASEHITSAKKYYQILESGKIKRHGYSDDELGVWMSHGKYWRRTGSYAPKETINWGFVFDPVQLRDKYQVKETWLAKVILEYLTKTRNLPRNEIESIINGFEIRQAPHGYVWNLADISYIESLMSKYNVTYDNLRQWSRRQAVEPEFGYEPGFIVEDDIDITDAVAVIHQGEFKVITEDTRGRPPEEWQFRDPTDDELEDTLYYHDIEPGKDMIIGDAPIGIVDDHVLYEQALDTVFANLPPHISWVKEQFWQNMDKPEYRKVIDEFNRLKSLAKQGSTTEDIKRFFGGSPEKNRLSSPNSKTNRIRQRLTRAAIDARMKKRSFGVEFEFLHDPSPEGGSVLGADFTWDQAMDYMRDYMGDDEITSMLMDQIDLLEDWWNGIISEDLRDSYSYTVESFDQMREAAKSPLDWDRPILGTVWGEMIEQLDETGFFDNADPGETDSIAELVADLGGYLKTDSTIETDTIDQVGHEIAFPGGREGMAGSGGLTDDYNALVGDDGFERLEKFIDQLSGLNTDVNESTGLHVHVGKGDLSAEEIGNVLMAWGKYEYVIDQLYAEWRRGSDGYSESIYEIGPDMNQTRANQNWLNRYNDVDAAIEALDAWKGEEPIYSQLSSALINWRRERYSASALQSGQQMEDIQDLISRTTPFSLWSLYEGRSLSANVEQASYNDILMLVAGGDESKIESIDKMLQNRIDELKETIRALGETGAEGEYIPWEQWLHDRIHNILKDSDPDDVYVDRLTKTRIADMTGRDKLNLSGTGSGHITMEFRGMEGTLDKEQVVNYVQFLLNFVERFRYEKVLPAPRAADPKSLLGEIGPTRAGQMWHDVSQTASPKVVQERARHIGVDHTRSYSHITDPQPVILTDHELMLKKNLIDYARDKGYNNEWVEKRIQFLEKFPEHLPNWYGLPIDTNVRELFAQTQRKITQAQEAGGLVLSRNEQAIKQFVIDHALTHNYDDAMTQQQIRILDANRDQAESEYGIPRSVDIDELYERTITKVKEAERVRVADGGLTDKEEGIYSGMTSLWRDRSIDPSKLDDEEFIRGFIRGMKQSGLYYGNVILANYSQDEIFDAFMSSRTKKKKKREEFKQKIKEKVPAGIKGARIDDPEDFAVLGQFIRNPSQESSWIVYIKDGEIIEHEVVTLNSPNSTVAPPVAALRERVEAFGADGVALLHNHPGASALFSPGDTDVTRRYIDEMSDIFYGTVVINSGTYAHLWRNEDGTYGRGLYAPGTPRPDLTRTRTGSATDDETQPVPTDLVKIDSERLGWDTDSPYQRRRGAAKPHEADPLYQTIIEGSEVEEWRRDLDELPRGKHAPISIWSDEFKEHLVDFGKHLRIDENWVVIGFMDRYHNINGLAEYKGLHNLNSRELFQFIRDRADKFGGEHLNIFIGEGDWYNTPDEAKNFFLDMMKDVQGFDPGEAQMGGYQSIVMPEGEVVITFPFGDHQFQETGSVETFRSFGGEADTGLAPLPMSRGDRGQTKEEYDHEIRTGRRSPSGVDPTKSSNVLQMDSDEFYSILGRTPPTQFDRKIEGTSQHITKSKSSYDEIQNQGKISSMKSLQEKGQYNINHMMMIDKLAGDDTLVFTGLDDQFLLNASYGFIFDPKQLVEELGAMVGEDLIYSYEAIMDDIVDGVVERYNLVIGEDTTFSDLLRWRELIKRWMYDQFSGREVQITNPDFHITSETANEIARLAKTEFDLSVAALHEKQRARSGEALNKIDDQTGLDELSEEDAERLEVVVKGEIPLDYAIGVVEEGKIRMLTEDSIGKPPETWKFVDEELSEQIMQNLEGANNIITLTRKLRGMIEQIRSMMVNPTDKVEFGGSTIQLIDVFEMEEAIETEQFNHISLLPLWRAIDMEQSAQFHRNIETNHAIHYTKDKQSFDGILADESLKSTSKLESAGGMLNPIDIMSKDDKYVFLDKGNYSRHKGYGFIFDSNALIDELNAVVGTKDLQDSYNRSFHRAFDKVFGHMNIENQVKYLVEDVIQNAIMKRIRQEGVQPPSRPDIQSRIDDVSDDYKERARELWTERYDLIQESGFYEIPQEEFVSLVDAVYKDYLRRIRGSQSRSRLGGDKGRRKIYGDNEDYEILVPDEVPLKYVVGVIDAGETKMLTPDSVGKPPSEWQYIDEQGGIRSFNRANDRQINPNESVAEVTRGAYHTIMRQGKKGVLSKPKEPAEHITRGSLSYQKIQRQGRIAAPYQTGETPVQPTTLYDDSGDNNRVYLSYGIQHGEEAGAYGFIFDTEQLVQDLNAKVGRDLAPDYWNTLQETIKEHFDTDITSDEMKALTEWVNTGSSEYPYEVRQVLEDIAERTGQEYTDMRIDKKQAIIDSARQKIRNIQAQERKVGDEAISMLERLDKEMADPTGTPDPDYYEISVDYELPLQYVKGVIENGQIKMLTADSVGKPPGEWRFEAEAEKDSPMVFRNQPSNYTEIAARTPSADAPRAILRGIDEDEHERDEDEPNYAQNPSRARAKYVSKQQDDKPKRKELPPITDYSNVTWGEVFGRAGYNLGKNSQEMMVDTFKALIEFDQTLSSVSALAFEGAIKGTRIKDLVNDIQLDQVDPIDYEGRFLMEGLDPTLADPKWLESAEGREHLENELGSMEYDRYIQQRKPSAINVNTELFDAVWQFYKDAYGLGDEGVGGLKRYIAEHPAEFLSDISMIGTAGVKAVSTASKTAATAKRASLIRRLRSKSAFNKYASPEIMTAIENGSHLSKYERLLPESVRLTVRNINDLERFGRAAYYIGTGIKQGGYAPGFWARIAEQVLRYMDTGNLPGVVVQGTASKTLRLFGDSKSPGVDPRLNDMARDLYQANHPARKALNVLSDLFVRNSKLEIPWDDNPNKRINLKLHLTGNQRLRQAERIIKESAGRDGDLVETILDHAREGQRENLYYRIMNHDDPIFSTQSFAGVPMNVYGDINRIYSAWAKNNTDTITLGHVATDVDGALRDSGMQDIDKRRVITKRVVDQVFREFKPDRLKDVLFKNTPFTVKSGGDVVAEGVFASKSTKDLKYWSGIRDGLTIMIFKGDNLELDEFKWNTGDEQIVRPTEIVDIVDRSLIDEYLPDLYPQRVPSSDVADLELWVPPQNLKSILDNIETQTTNKTDYYDFQTWRAEVDESIPTYLNGVPVEVVDAYVQLKRESPEVFEALKMYATAVSEWRGFDNVENVRKDMLSKHHPYFQKEKEKYTRDEAILNTKTGYGLNNPIGGWGAVRTFVPGYEILDSIAGEGVFYIPMKDNKVVDMADAEYYVPYARVGKKYAGDEERTIDGSTHIAHGLDHRVTLAEGKLDPQTIDIMQELIDMGAYMPLDELDDKLLDHVGIRRLPKDRTMDDFIKDAYTKYHRELRADDDSWTPEMDNAKRHRPLFHDPEYEKFLGELQRLRELEQGMTIRAKGGIYEFGVVAIDSVIEYFDNVDDAFNNQVDSYLLKGINGGDNQYENVMRVADRLDRSNWNSDLAYYYERLMGGVEEAHRGELSVDAADHFDRQVGGGVSAEGTHAKSLERMERKYGYAFFLISQYKRKPKPIGLSIEQHAEIIMNLHELAYAFGMDYYQAVANAASFNNKQFIKNLFVSPESLNLGIEFMEADTIRDVHAIIDKHAPDDNIPYDSWRQIHAETEEMFGKESQVKRILGAVGRMDQQFNKATRQAQNKIKRAVNDLDNIMQSVLTDTLSRLNALDIDNTRDVGKVFTDGRVDDAEVADILNTISEKDRLGIRNAVVQHILRQSREYAKNKYHRYAHVNELPFFKHSEDIELGWFLDNLQSYNWYKKSGGEHEFSAVDARANIIRWITGQHKEQYMDDDVLSSIIGREVDPARKAQDFEAAADKLIEMAADEKFNEIMELLQPGGTAYIIKVPNNPGATRTLDFLDYHIQVWRTGLFTHPNQDRALRYWGGAGGGVGQNRDAQVLLIFDGEQIGTGLGGEAHEPIVVPTEIISVADTRGGVGYDVVPPEQGSVAAGKIVPFTPAKGMEVVLHNIGATRLRAIFGEQLEEIYALKDISKSFPTYKRDTFERQKKFQDETLNPRFAETQGQPRLTQDEVDELKEFTENATKPGNFVSKFMMQTASANDILGPAVVFALMGLTDAEAFTILSSDWGMKALTEAVPVTMREKVREKLRTYKALLRKTQAVEEKTE